MKQMNDTNSCSLATAELMQHFDDGTLESLPLRLQAHLETCRDCREEHSSLIHLEKSLDDLPDADPGEAYWINFLRELQQRLGEVSKPRRNRDMAWVPALALAASFIILAFRTSAPVAPPNWFQLQPNAAVLWNLESIGNGGFTNIEEESLANTVFNAEFVEVFLGEGSAELFENLYEPPQILPVDMSDRIANLDEKSQDAFFKKLRNLPIIKS